MPADSKTLIAYGSDNLADAQAALAAKGVQGFEVVVANEYELMLDYDTKEVPPIFQKVIAIFDKHHPNLYGGYQLHRSKSDNTHVIVKLNHKMSITERIAWQAIFGSDGVHEALNMIAAKREVSAPVLMFMPKDRDNTIHGLKEDVARRFRP